MNISVRISAAFLMVSALGFFFFARQEIGDTTRRYREATEEPLVDFAHVLAGIVSEESKDGTLRTEHIEAALKQVLPRRIHAQIYNLEKTSVDIRVYVVDRKGMVVFDSANRDLGKDYSKWIDVALTLRGEYGARSSRDDPEHGGSILYVAAPIIVSNQILGSLTVAKPNDNANRFILGTKRNTVLLGLLTFFGVGVLAAILSLVVTRPIHALTTYARGIRDGKKLPLPRLGKGEIKTLGLAFEEMREALEGRKYVEQYVQTLTHEIKSPLTAIRGAIELLKENPPEPSRSQFIANIERESARAQDLVNKLLSLSSLQRKGTLEKTSVVMLSELAADVQEQLFPLIQRKGIEIHSAIEPDIRVSGDRFWLEEACRNLLHNAIDFTPENGVIEYSLKQFSNQACLRIKDSGPGVPEWAKERVFEKFYSLPRPDTNKRSSGLGLTIVQEVVTLHNGSITLESHPEGGAIAQIFLPISPVSPKS